MNAPGYVRAFATLAACAGGAVYRLPTEQLQVFWVLRNSLDLPEHDYLTPSQVSDILADCSGIAIPRQRVGAILDSAGSAVKRRRLKKRNHYKIMKPGLDALDDALNQGSQAAVFVDPSKALTQIRQIETIFAGLKGIVRICDPYVDNKTLDVLSACDSASEIRFLTVNVHRDTALRRDLAAFRNEHRIPLEIRVAPPGKHHDRYVLSDNEILQFGASLNGLAKKQSFIVPLPTSMRGLLQQAFDSDWSSSPNFA